MISFEEFVRSKGFEVMNGLVRLSDVEKVAELVEVYEVERIREEGLPEEFVKERDRVVTAEFETVDGDSLDPVNFGCELEEEEGVWSITGSVRKIWDWGLSECARIGSELYVWQVEEALGNAVREAKERED